MSYLNKSYQYEWTNATGQKYRIKMWPSNTDVTTVPANTSGSYFDPFVDFKFSSFTSVPLPDDGYNNPVQLRDSFIVSAPTISEKFPDAMPRGWVRRSFSFTVNAAEMMKDSNQDIKDFSFEIINPYKKHLLDSGLQIDISFFKATDLGTKLQDVSHLRPGLQLGLSCELSLETAPNTWRIVGRFVSEFSKDVKLLKNGTVELNFVDLLTHTFESISMIDVANSVLDGTQKPTNWRDAHVVLYRASDSDAGLVKIGTQFPTAPGSPGEDDNRPVLVKLSWFNNVLIALVNKYMEIIWRRPITFTSKTTQSDVTDQLLLNSIEFRGQFCPEIATSNESSKWETTTHGPIWVVANNFEKLKEYKSLYDFMKEHIEMIGYSISVPFDSSKECLMFKTLLTDDGIAGDVIQNVQSGNFTDPESFDVSFEWISGVEVASPGVEGTVRIDNFGSSLGQLDYNLTSYFSSWIEKLEIESLLLESPPGSGGRKYLTMNKKWLPEGLLVYDGTGIHPDTENTFVVVFPLPIAIKPRSVNRRIDNYYGDMFWNSSYIPPYGIDLSDDLKYDRLGEELNTHLTNFCLTIQRGFSLYVELARGVLRTLGSVESQRTNGIKTYYKVGLNPISGSYVVPIHPEIYTGRKLVFQKTKNVNDSVSQLNPLGTNPPFFSIIRSDNKVALLDPATNIDLINQINTQSVQICIEQKSDLVSGIQELTFYGLT